MTQTRTLTVSETAKLVGVTVNTVYKDIKRGALYAYDRLPTRFVQQDVTKYRLDKVEQFFDRMEEFRGRTKVNTVALAFAFGVDPSLFSHWKRGVSLPQGDTVLKANQMLNGSDHEVVQRIIDKFSNSMLDMHGVATLDKLTKILGGLPVNGNGKSNNIAIDTERTAALLAQDLTEKAKAVEAEGRQPKRKKREHTSNVLNSTMRSDITDWMHREGKSNSYVARMLGVKSPGAVAGWLKGKHINMPNLEKVEALCRDQQIPMGEGYQPALPSVGVDTIEDDADDVIEVGGISGEREEFLLRTQEFTIDLLEAQERVRSVRRLLMEHLEEELENSAF